MAKHNETGNWGETLAADFLASNGYAIAERNWRSGHYELDIVAYKDNRIVFVEVKTRSDIDEDPVDAIDSRKAMRLIHAAMAYIESHDIYHELQFDVIAVNGSPAKYKIEHIADAFQSPLHTY